METTQETIVDDDGGREVAIARADDTSEASSLSEQTQSQDIQGQCPACSSNDVQYIERRIIQRLDDSLKESFRSLINSIERRFSELETNVNKIQDQLQSIQQQLPAQNFRGHESLIYLQFAEDCCEDLEKEDEGSTDSYANVHAYVQSMQRYQKKHGARHLPPQRPPSRVMRQRRISSRYSLTYPFVTDTITL